MIRRPRLLAFVMSLVVLASAAWLPTSVFAQAFPGAGAGSSSTTFTDTTFSVCDDGDPTKCAKFQASGISTGTTRTFTFPNADATFAVLGTNQTFGAVETFSNQAIFLNNASMSFGTGGLGSINYRTVHTPDTVYVGVPPASNSWNVGEEADAGTDANNGSCGTAACTHPQVNIHDADATTVTQYNSQAYWGNAGRATKTLTEASATSAFQYSIASGVGAGGIVDFTVFATDSTDQQTLTGVLQFSGVNKAGTETCPTPTLTGTALNAVSTGTLTCSYAQDTTPTNACNVQFNCTSSLTQTTLEVYYRVNLVGPGQVTPQ